jgi:hypothetical protein
MNAVATVAFAVAVLIALALGYKLFYWWSARWLAAQPSASLLDQPFFMQVLAPYLRVGLALHDKGQARIDFPNLPDDLLAQAKRRMKPCVACGKLIHFVRVGGHGRGYYAATCPQNVSRACSRTQAAREEYARIRVYAGRA